MNKIDYIDITKLKSHEAILPKKLAVVINNLTKTGYLKNPVVVARESLTILDGHHRVAALKKLGAKKIPVYLVDYMDKNVRVYLRRKEFLMAIIKNMVVKTASENKTFPSKTTRHIIKEKPQNMNIGLDQLR